MSNDDNKELNTILKAACSPQKSAAGHSRRPSSSYDDGWDEEDMIPNGLTQWSTHDQRYFSLPLVQIRS
jgi:hypothetical protein